MASYSEEKNSIPAETKTKWNNLSFNQEKKCYAVLWKLARKFLLQIGFTSIQEKKCIAKHSENSGKCSLEFVLIVFSLGNGGKLGKEKLDKEQQSSQTKSNQAQMHNMAQTQKTTK